MQTPLGKTTFGNYIRRTRNTLGTHGNLLFYSLPVTERNISFSDEDVLKFQTLMEKLIQEVQTLKNKLEDYISNN
jgi:hypothetical protein